jgi:hypothetical protein
MAYDLFSFPRDYEVQCNTVWAMTDFTEQNGATRVIPGSKAVLRRSSPMALSVTMQSSFIGVFIRGARRRCGSSPKAELARQHSLSWPEAPERNKPGFAGRAHYALCKHGRGGGGGEA